MTTDLPPSTGIQLIVGLGNPGSEYANTRHNAGYWFVDQLCEAMRGSLSIEAKFKGAVGTVQVADKLCRVLQPSTYMNRSGQSVSALAKFYKIAPHEILVVHDELDLPPGSARLKMDGGHGGHNGLKDIIAHLGTKQFYRLRLGIGHPGNSDDVVDYVLHKPSLQDKTNIFNAISHAMSAMPDIITGKMDKAMKNLHTIAK